jgi:hypothetical protein
VNFALIGGVILASGCGDDDGAVGSHASTAPATAGLLQEPPRSPEARAAGRRACRGRDAAAVRRAYLDLAERRATNAERGFVRAARRLSRPRSRIGERIAARLYAMTLPRHQRRDGYLGCAHELASPAGANGSRS